MSTIPFRRQLAARLPELAILHFQHGWRLLRGMSVAALIIPTLCIAFVLLLSRTPYLWLVEKSTQEVIAPSILAVGVFVAWLFWARAGHFYSRWLLLLSGALFCRELHFWGTNNGIYVAILALLWHASRNFGAMRPLTHSRLLSNLFGGAMLAYFISKTLDRNYWYFFAGWTDWQDTLEETLESTAHLQILGFVTSSYALWGRQWHTAMVQQTELGSRIRRWTVLAIASVLGIVTVNRWFGEAERPIRSAGDFPIELSSLCNVDPRLGDNLFLASSDEDPRLVVWTIDASGAPQALQRLALEFSDADGRVLHLGDLEDIAWDGRETYFAVGSHRHIVPSEDQSRRDKSHGTECALVSFQLQPSAEGLAIVNSQIVTQELLTKIKALGVFRSIDWQSSKTFSWQGLVKTWQINIEGLAHLDGQLLLGFKDPVENGRATILSLDPATGELTVAAQPDLQGHGILSLHYDANRDQLLLLSNEPLKHRYADSCLWIGTRGTDERWTFRPSNRFVIESASANKHRKASGLTIRRDQLAVCFDSESESPIRIVPTNQIFSSR